MPRVATCICGKCRKCCNRRYKADARAYHKKLTTILRVRVAKIQRSFYPYIEAQTSEDNLPWTLP